ncbi:FAD binding domain-containing protein [Sediminispirochaeta smaragdinae]|uniref:Molybdopterin dehydrogenase FAD-binding protein n=1 Tax=Sediminispirochaeta smaragdinae (strain DSM 11293 / JCM 15392 / SEBR 4228) TaxID=573413 RepID=E1R8T0_SEDSS|nr:FAD binding domain-containing protein [Sediminispirochaeta smaragdinae]ADK81837.1 molybdopterin dehydrogenase FAD-binding protein [Sediminispirochaeta smaragdinae DSM 11293]
MVDMEFLAAKNKNEVLSLLDKYGSKARPVAGGTDLMIGIREGRLPGGAHALIDISRIPELSYIKKEGTWLRIGAGTTHAQIAASELVLHESLILQDASASVGSPQIRNRGTIGGNIVTAAQCADTVPALMVLDACVVLESVAGRREVPIVDFFPGPKKSDVHPGELVTEIRFPSIVDGYGASFEKLIRRKAVAKSRLNFAVVALQDASGMIQEMRLAIGSALPTTSRFPTVEQMLIGKRGDEGLLKEAGLAAAAYMIEKGGIRWSTDYKKPVVEKLVSRNIARALALEE